MNETRQLLLTLVMMMVIIIPGLYFIYEIDQRIFYLILVIGFIGLIAGLRLVGVSFREVKESIKQRRINND